MTPSQITLMIATLRLGGIRSVMHADALVNTAFNLRPAVFAQSLAAGKSAEMVKLISAADLPRKIAEMAKERN